VKLEVDTESGRIVVDGEPMALYSDEGFRAVSDLWLKVGWNQKYSYTFTWLGVPIIQLPEDLIRYQEIVARLKPDVIVETGIAHGGSAIFSASLCRLIGKGRVIAIDIRIRPSNRAAIENHPLGDLITLIEGSSTAPNVVEKVKALIRPGESVLVVLDSDHGHAHVSGELAAYAPLVTPGSYIVATDGVMRDLTEVPRGARHWDIDNPARAAREFAASHPEFVLEPPPRGFSEATFTNEITYWPDAWLRRVD
jgi:cephalosporin hydroxylase